MSQPSGLEKTLKIAQIATFRFRRMMAVTIFSVNSVGQCSVGFAWVDQKSILGAVLTTSLSVTLKKMLGEKEDLNSCKRPNKMPML